jgi:hypothetical protein
MKRIKIALEAAAIQRELSRSQLNDAATDLRPMVESKGTQVRTI